jgi:hypothetical protein
MVMATKKVVVKQSTIDQIKKMGMTASLKKAAKSGNTEFVEGVRRMYGERRLSAAIRSVPAAKTPDAARAKAAAKAKMPVAKSPDEARRASSANAPKSTPKPKKADWRTKGIGPVVSKNIKSGDWRKKGLFG